MLKILKKKNIKQKIDCRLEAGCREEKGQVMQREIRTGWRMDKWAGCREEVGQTAEW